MCSTFKLRIAKFTGPKTAPVRSERTVLPGQRRADSLSGEALASKATLQVMFGAEDRPSRSERTVLPGQRRAHCLSGEALPSKATVLVMKSAWIDLEIRPVLRIQITPLPLPPLRHSTILQTRSHLLGADPPERCFPTPPSETNPGRQGSIHARLAR